jgi:hypothetical protein
MPKFKVKYVYERWYDLELEAEDRDQAMEIFHAGHFDAEPRVVGGEVQDSIVIEEVSA